MAEVNNIPLPNYDFVKSAGLKSILDQDKSGKTTNSDFQKMSPSKLKLAEKAVKADTILTKEQKETILTALKLSNSLEKIILKIYKENPDLYLKLKIDDYILRTH